MTAIKSWGIALIVLSTLSTQGHSIVAPLPQLLGILTEGLEDAHQLAHTAPVVMAFYMQSKPAAAYRTKMLLVLKPNVITQQRQSLKITRNIPYTPKLHAQPLPYSNLKRNKIRGNCLTLTYHAKVGTQTKE